MPTLPVSRQSQNLPTAIMMPSPTAKAVMRRVMMTDSSGCKRPGRPRLFG